MSFGVRLFLRLSLCIFLLFAGVSVTFAQGAQFPGDIGPSGIVPCGDAGEPECQACHLQQLAQEVMNVLVYLAIFAATLAFAWAGFLYLTARGEKGKIESYHKIFWNVFIGIVIILVAWIVVDTIMKVFRPESRFGPWNSIFCVEQPAASSESATRPGLESERRADHDTYAGVPGCPSCKALSREEFPIKESACRGGECSLDPTVSGLLLAMRDELETRGIEWQITEAYPLTPTVTHRNPCHQGGACIDAALRGNYSAADIVSFQQAADKWGLLAIYEVKDPIRRAELFSAGVPYDSILVVPQATGEHFSVYKRERPTSPSGL